MPIYMDRHQGEQVTPQMVAEAHAADIKIQHKYGCNFITYWYDEKRSSVFCLVDAPDIGAVHKVHGESHGFSYNEIMEVDPNIVRAFLGRVEDPTPVAGEVVIDSPFRSIMFTDLEGSTDMINTLGDDMAMELLRVHNSIIRDALRYHSGHEIKHTGDGFMVSFTSAVSAVECAIDIQKTMVKYNEGIDAQSMNVRIGISAGEPVRNDKQLYGAAVNLAARLCTYAQPGGILVAQVVKDLCVGKTIPFVGEGEFQAKGFEGFIPIFEVAWRDM